jgi:hypothetical protein
MSDEDLKAELDRLRSENAALKKGGSSNVRMKVSEKGAVSVYGMGRFPVTLYKGAVAEAPGHVGRHSRFHRCKRSAIEGQGMRVRSREPVCKHVLLPRTVLVPGANVGHVMPPR